MDKWVVIMILGIVAISAFSRIQRAKYGDYGRLRRRGHFEPQGGLLDPAQPSAREKELQKEVEDLRERIHVLERIATDGRHSNSLAAEIESLRGK